EDLRRSGYNTYVWVVDGQSVDATLEVAKDRGASVYVQSGEGKGNGVRQALDLLMSDRNRQHIEGPKIYVMLDADGTYPPEQVPIRTGILIAWRLLMRRLNQRDMRDLQRPSAMSQVGRAAEQ